MTGLSEFSVYADEKPPPETDGFNHLPLGPDGGRTGSFGVLVKALP